MTADIVERLRDNATLPVCPFDRRSPDYKNTSNDKPCSFCGGTEEVDKCQGADLRILNEAANALTAARAEIEALRAALSRQNEEICQTLGKVLGYPWFKDDQANFPGTTEADGVCVGEHVAESLAADTVSTIEALRAKVEALEGERAWRPISEAPRDWTLFLTWNGHAYGLSRWLMVGGRYFLTEDNRDHPPTHWQPLPSPPKATP